MKTKGFTLVELLVVIAILAILATVSVVGFTSYINNANASKAEQELSQLRTYALAYDLADATGTDAKDGKVSLEEVNACITKLYGTVETKPTASENSGAVVVSYTVGTATVTMDMNTGAVTKNTGSK